MPTLRELLNEKAARLESVPDKLETRLITVQKELLKAVEELLSKFDIDRDGYFVVSQANFDLANELDVLLREVLDRSEYAEAVTEFAKEFNTQIGVNNAYFVEAFKGFEKSEIGELIVRQAQKNAVEILINSTPNTEFIYPIKQQIENAIVTGSRFRETLDNLQDWIIGYTDTEGTFKEGKLVAHSKQIAHDTFAVADRSYANAVAEEFNAQWFVYSGGVIKTTRPFCRERHNKYFCKKEIELWGAGTNTDTKEFKTPQQGGWQGKMDGTDSRTIFVTAGGYNCMHSIMAISIFAVPKDQIQRAIDLGYFTPTGYEKRRLGL